MAQQKVTLVKFLTNDEGEEYSKEDQVWHLVVNIDAPRSFCGGEVFGVGESSAKFQTKQVQRGITCHNCIALVKAIKSVRL